MIRYKKTTGDNSVKLEFESMCELFQYLEYKKKEEFGEVKSTPKSIAVTEWKNTID